MPLRLGDDEDDAQREALADDDAERADERLAAPVRESDPDAPKDCVCRGDGERVAVVTLDEELCSDALFAAEDTDDADAVALAKESVATALGVCTGVVDPQSDEAALAEGDEVDARDADEEDVRDAAAVAEALARGDTDAYMDRDAELLTLELREAAADLEGLVLTLDERVTEGDGDKERDVRVVTVASGGEREARGLAQGVALRALERLIVSVALAFEDAEAGGDSVPVEAALWEPRDVADVLGEGDNVALPPNEADEQIDAAPDPEAVPASPLADSCAEIDSDAEREGDASVESVDEAHALEFAEGSAVAQLDTLPDSDAATLAQALGDALALPDALSQPV